MKMEQNRQTIISMKKHLTQKSEPGKEGGRSEVEQWQKQYDKVERDGVGFIPVSVKHCIICTVVTDIMPANASVIWIHIWVWTNHWKR